MHTVIAAEVVRCSHLEQLRWSDALIYSMMVILGGQMHSFIAAAMVRCTQL
jgi:hypothetical protein